MRPDQLPDDRPVVVMIIDVDCHECEHMEPLVRELQRQNSSTGIELVTIDVWEDPDAALEFEALTHPTLILHVNGHERARLAGAATKRHLLRAFLPYLHPDPDDALARLREQTANPVEGFPRRGVTLVSGARRPDRLEMLRSVPLFAGLTKRRLGLVARYADETEAAAGQVLAREGEVGDEFHLIVEGSAVVTKDGLEIAHLGSGDFFGEMALLDAEPRSATVTMGEDSVLLAIHRRDFEFLLDRVPGLSREVLVAVVRRLREADRRLGSG